MEGLEEQLRQLVKEACRHLPGSTERQKNLTKIIRLVSKRLWRENTSYYQDALQQTWLYFCQNICEGKTGQAYDPTRSSVITWLNFYLKRRLQDFYINAQKQQTRTVLQSGSGYTDEITNLLENLAATPDTPPILENVMTWAKNDPDGELCRIHIKDHPEVTAQVLILQRLPPEVSWNTMAVKFGIPASTLSNFYQRQCLPRLRKFGESEGYL